MPAAETVSSDDAPIAMLLGPTASGKSAVAMALARRLPIEIVTVDSAQVYRGMDIGTAKPTAAERAAVPHHLIDIVDPRDSYSAARFVADAQAAIAQVRSGGRWPRPPHSDTDSSGRRWSGASSSQPTWPTCRGQCSSLPLQVCSSRT